MTVVMIFFYFLLLALSVVGFVFGLLAFIKVNKLSPKAAPAPVQPQYVPQPQYTPVQPQYPNNMQ